MINFDKSEFNQQFSHGMIKIFGLFLCNFPLSFKVLINNNFVFQFSIVVVLIL